MKIRCDYCGNYYDDSKDNCPKCGASSKCSSEENDITAIEKNSDSHANKKIKKPKTILIAIFICVPTIGAIGGAGPSPGEGGLGYPGP